MEKFRGKKNQKNNFYSTFRGLCPWSVLIFLSCHPTSSHLIFPDLLWTASDWSDFLGEVFYVSVLDEEHEKRVIFKILESPCVVSITLPFLLPFLFCQPSLHQLLHYIHPSHLSITDSYPHFVLVLSVVYVEGRFARWNSSLVYQGNLATRRKLSCRK